MLEGGSRESGYTRIPTLWHTGLAGGRECAAVLTGKTSMLEGRPKLKMDGIMPIMVSLFIRFAIRVVWLPVTLRIRTMPIVYVFGSITNARTYAPMPGLGLPLPYLPETSPQVSSMFDSLEDKMRKLNSAGSLAFYDGSSFFLCLMDRLIGVSAGQAAYTWEAWIQYVEILDENPSGSVGSGSAQCALMYVCRTVCAVP